MNKEKYRIFTINRDKINFSSVLVVQSDKKFNKEDTVIFIDDGVPAYARLVISRAINYMLLDELYRQIPYIPNLTEIENICSLYSINCGGIRNYIKRIDDDVSGQIHISYCRINSIDFTLKNCTKFPILILWEGPR